MEDDDTGAPAQRVHDPAVRLRVVPDVVERDVGASQQPAARAGDLDVHPLLQRRQQRAL